MNEELKKSSIEAVTKHANLMRDIVCAISKQENEIEELRQYILKLEQTIKQMSTGKWV